MPNSDGQWGRFTLKCPQIQSFRRGRNEIMKEKYAFWLTPETKALLEENYRKADCKSQSEFVEKAIRFYCGYLISNTCEEYLPKLLAGMMEGYLNQAIDRMGRLLFKSSVEQAICNHLIAAESDLDFETLERLRARAVNDVKRSNGKITFKEILKFQKELI